MPTAVSQPTPALQPNAVRTLLVLAWPMIISRSTQVVIGICDAVMVAHLGEASLAATTTGAVNVFTLLIFPMGVVFIVASFASQLFGAGDVKGARRYGWYGLGIGLVTQGACFVTLPFVPQLLSLAPYAQDVRELMASYLVMRLLTAGAVIGTEAFASYYGGLGRTRLPMIANVVAMVANVAGNWLLIRGNLGLPAMGVKGAALASAISSVVAFGVLFSIFLYEGEHPRLELATLRLKEFGRMLRFGLPSGFNWFFEFFAFSFWMNVVVAGLGTTSLAAMMAVLQINNVSAMPAFALASAGAILVGQRIGAGRKDEVAHVLKTTFATAGVWMVLVSAIYLSIPALLLQAFSSNDANSANFLAVGVRMLMLATAWQLFDAAAMTQAEALRAAGDTTFTLWARMIIAWLIFAPGSYITVRYFGWGDKGSVMWVVGYMAVLSAVLLVRFRSGKWKEIQLVEAPALVH